MMMETVPSGTVLHGRYRIERVLGSGGFGHVYLAVDLQKNNQQYAVKEYFVTGSSGQAQLQHEARVLNQLHHPNLPAFQEAFNERGHYFAVLSYIEGNDLTDLIRATRQKNETIPLTRVLDWILAVCDAVQFLHTQQPPVIHRDIKPDNIRITPDGTAILVDLGNAKATADGARTLFFIRHQGTPGYAPQEQYPGGTGTDTRSDIYALGATLYFALTAQEPPSVSSRNQAIQQGQPDLPSLQERLARNPPEESADPANRQFRAGGPKSGRSVHRHIRHLAQLGTLPPELLDQLNRIIKRAMAMRQKDRYQSIGDFRTDLKNVRDALPAPPSPPSPPPSGRLPDPHSTQPDLPMLYEALEAAKNNPPPSVPQHGAAHQTASPRPEPAQTGTCPRCGQALAPQASFCPRCGYSLTPNFKANPPASATLTDSRHSNKASSSNPAHDEDDTIVIRPQAKAQAQVHTHTSTAQSQPRPFIVSPPQASTISSIAQSQSQSPSARPSQTPPASSTASSNTPAGFSSQSKLILTIVIVILLVLIAIFLFFIISHGPRTSGSIAPWHSTGIQVAHYVYNTTFTPTSSFARLWTRSTSPAPLAGLT